jgi:hypothetical protein
MKAVVSSDCIASVSSKSASLLHPGR